MQQPDINKLSFSLSHSWAGEYVISLSEWIESGPGKRFLRQPGQAFYEGSPVSISNIPFIYRNNLVSRLLIGLGMFDDPWINGRFPRHSKLIFTDKGFDPDIPVEIKRLEGGDDYMYFTDINMSIKCPETLNLFLSQLSPFELFSTMIPNAVTVNSTQNEPVLWFENKKMVTFTIGFNTLLGMEMIFDRYIPDESIIKNNTITRFELDKFRIFRSVGDLKHKEIHLIITIVEIPVFDDSGYATTFISLTNDQYLDNCLNFEQQMINSINWG